MSHRKKLSSTKNHVNRMKGKKNKATTITILIQKYSLESIIINGEARQNNNNNKNLLFP